MLNSVAMQDYRTKLMATTIPSHMTEEQVDIRTAREAIRGTLCIPKNAAGTVVFAHGAGSNRLSPRNRYVADVLQKDGFATLLLDLISEKEEQLNVSGRLSFDIALLAGRVDAGVEFVLQDRRLSKLSMGLFGASTGAAAALVAAVQRPETIGAIVARGGRPDLARHVLSEVQPPTLLIVGSEDAPVLEKNEQATAGLTTQKKLVIIQGATHLFEEPGTLEKVAEHARAWFRQYLIGEEPVSADDRPYCHVDAYSFGRIVIDAKAYNADLIMFPHGIRPDWRRMSGHTVCLDDLESVVDYHPEVLVVGTGSAGQMHMEEAAREYLKQEGVRCIEQQTAEAVRTFNAQVEKGTRTAGVFHLTC